MPMFPSDPRAVTVLAPELVDAVALLDALAPLGTGDVFCAAAPDDGLDDAYDDEEPFAYYSATFSDTVATFVVEVERSTSSAQARYEVHVADSGPGAERLRYRLAKAVVAATGGFAADAEGGPVVLAAPPEDPFGALW
ncbi:hypothetical protein [Actinospica robiniae]|uniref:hypothetical protein n=1 Tax=Actinospica robiniae TaxID=304901 RepID=UPI00054FFCCE|nr:hypothetical protein [Actinospica robiniae]